MPIAEGSKIPADAAGFTLQDGHPNKVTMGDLLAGQKAVIFGLPGAYTGTCTNQHLPSYVKEAQALKAKGVDQIYCLAVNDVFVLEAWNKQHGSDDITMLSDGNGDITRALDLGFDASAFGLGFRSKRFAMYLEDGVIKALDVEEKPSACSVSTASAILARI